eukprot:CAMPEP_0195057032 /NCGR_PEP_ID=MMETSP0448-20130528/5254_1 /TAXON_ID=66468 /ORGANISM="Heterocapsa triquestra, Strain CCMP 448" /LENGTH=237 /DNA_ID=CAMNT_0040086951 /DNA_START=232 /DNA_END=944 /DNA_ORIENTATION=-
MPSAAPSRLLAFAARRTELVPNLGLVEGELLAVVDVHDALPEGVALAAVAGLQRQPLTVAGLLRADPADQLQVPVVAARQAEGGTVLIAADGGVLPLAVWEEVLPCPLQRIRDPVVGQSDAHDLHVAQIVVVVGADDVAVLPTAGVARDGRDLAFGSPEDLLLGCPEYGLHLLKWPGPNVHLHLVEAAGGLQRLQNSTAATQRAAASTGAAAMAVSAREHPPPSPNATGWQAGASPL